MGRKKLAIITNNNLFVKLHMREPEMDYVLFSIENSLKNFSMLILRICAFELLAFQLLRLVLSVGKFFRMFASVPVIHFLINFICRLFF